MWQVMLTRPFFLNAFGLCLMTAFAVGLFVELPRAWLLIFGAALCLFFGNADKIKLFEFGQKGFKAETHQVLQEARNTISELHILAKKLAEYLLWMLQAEGRLGGGINPAGKEEFRAGLLATLRELGLTEQQIVEIGKVEHPYIRFDYAHWVPAGIRDRLSPDQMAAWDAFYLPWKNTGIGGEPSPDELERFLQEQGLLDGEIAERLTDYRHWEQHKRHRRPDVWLNRRKPEKRV